MIFGLFKKTSPPPRNPPPLTDAMIQPADKPITLSDAKRLFREYTLAVGALDKGEVALHVQYLVEDFKEHERELQEDVQQFKDVLNEAAQAVKSAKKDLAKAKSQEEKDEAEERLEEAEFNLESAKEEYEPAAQALADFKADKRQFLIDYVNRQFQQAD